MKKGRLTVQIDRRDVPENYTIVHLVTQVEQKLKAAFPGAKIVVTDAEIERAASK